MRLQPRMSELSMRPQTSKLPSGCSTPISSVAMNPMLWALARSMILKTPRPQCRKNRRKSLSFGSRCSKIDIVSVMQKYFIFTILTMLVIFGVLYFVFKGKTNDYVIQTNPSDLTSSDTSVIVTPPPVIKNPTVNIFYKKDKN